MSDADQEKEMVIQCAESMMRVGLLIKNAAALDLHPALDWEQLLRYVNEQMLLGCENSMFSDPAKQLEALNKVIVGIAVREHRDICSLPTEKSE